MRIQGLSVLVTGGASGLGLATAVRLAERGARVVLLDLPASEGEKAAARLGGAARFVPADVTDPGTVTTALEAAEVNGPLRAVVHCAGRGGDRLRILDSRRNPGDLGAFTEVVRVNLIGTYNVLRLAAAHMSGRLGAPDDYAQLAVSMIENPYLNGETIRLDGAIRLAPR